MTTKETIDHLISDRESGKAVYGAGNKRIGSVESVMIDKTSGEIAYAVLSFGGFLGIGLRGRDTPEKLFPEHKCAGANGEEEQNQ